MSIIKKITPFLLVLTVIAGSFYAYTHVTNNLKTIISKSGSKNTGSDFSIGKTGLSFPLCLELKNVKYKNLITAPSVKIYPNLISLFLKDKLLISAVKISDPVIDINKKDVTNFNLIAFIKKIEDLIPYKFVYFSSIYMKNCIFSFSKNDRQLFEFVDIEGVVKGPKLYFPRDRKFDFSARGYLKNPESDILSPVSMGGKITLDKKVKGDLLIDDIKISAVDQFYESRFISLIKEASVDFHSDFMITENFIKATCAVIGNDVVLEKAPDTKKETPLAISMVLLYSFKSKILKIKDLKGNLYRFFSN